MTLNIHSIECVAGPDTSPVYGATGDVIGVQPGTRLQRVVRWRENKTWQLWLSTRDYEYGTSLLLYGDGAVTNITLRKGEGPDIFDVRPPDSMA